MRRVRLTAQESGDDELNCRADAELTALGVAGKDT